MNQDTARDAKAKASGFVVPITKLGYMLEHPVSIRHYSLPIVKQ